MSRPFSPIDARRLLSLYSKAEEAHQEISSSGSYFKGCVETATKAMVATEVIKVLREIPVEELNRNKRGIRVKNLRECGYNTIADIASASVYSLASVYGISEDTAYTIKRISNDIVSKARQGIKIRLSADNKNKESTALVLALYQYQEVQSLIERFEVINRQHERGIDWSIKDLKAAGGALRWLFASQEKKQRAILAFNYLSTLIEGNYGTEVNDLCCSYASLRKVSNNVAWDDFLSHPIQYFNNLENIDPGVLGNDDSMYGLPEDLAREIQEECFFPEGLHCELRRYQEWGVKYALHQERILLGDEMGLGKTVQAIATMVSLRNTGGTHFVVVCPASVITNWCREIRKMSSLSVTKVHGQGRNLALKSWMRTGGVAVTTYETTNYFDLPDDYKFTLLVVDEAHYIKNPEAKRTENVVALSQHTSRLMFMTGTALENNVEEMISLIDILQPEIASRIGSMTFMSAAPQFRKAVAPVYYRRKREDVLTELPELIETKEWCGLTAEEEDVYEEAILSKSYMEARRVSWDIDNIERSSKAKRLLELIEDAKNEGRKVIVFSFFLDTIRKISLLLGNRCMNPINGSVNPQRRQEIIDDFEKAPAGSVLCAQIQSGGTGLNIQTASVVIICEPQFKPSIENQAISRAYRMGQTRNVLVYRLLCEGTIDEKLMETLEDKQAIFDAFADKSVAARESLEIDEKTFGNIIKEEIDRINAKRAKEGKS